jgi:hypothetical protein
MRHRIQTGRLWKEDGVISTWRGCVSQPQMMSNICSAIAVTTGRKTTSNKGLKQPNSSAALQRDHASRPPHTQQKVPQQIHASDLHVAVSKSLDHDSNAATSITLFGEREKRRLTCQESCLQPILQGAEFLEEQNVEGGSSIQVSISSIFRCLLQQVKQTGLTYA